MKSVTDHLREHLFNTVFKGYYTPEFQVKKPEIIKLTQWSSTFEYMMRREYISLVSSESVDESMIVIDEELFRLMRNRLLQGAFRYVPMDIQREQKSNYDHLAEIPRRLRKFTETKNIEFLVDAANFCLTSAEVGWFPIIDKDLSSQLNTNWKGFKGFKKILDPSSFEILQDNDIKYFFPYKISIDGLIFNICNKIYKQDVVPIMFCYKMAAIILYLWEIYKKDCKLSSCNEDNAIHMKGI